MSYRNGLNPATAEILDLCWVDEFVLGNTPSGVTIHGGATFPVHTTIGPDNLLPKGLIIWGDLIIRGSKLEKLPDDIDIRGSCDITDSAIRELPDGLNVGGYLCADNTPIEKLPNNMNIGGSLYLRGVNVSLWPKEMNVGGIIITYGTNLGYTTRWDIR